jgi:hypothetical protein
LSCCWLTRLGRFHTDWAFTAQTCVKLNHSSPDYMSHVINPLRPSGSYINHLLWQSVMLHFVFIGFVWFSL